MVITHWPTLSTHFLPAIVLIELDRPVIIIIIGSHVKKKRKKKEEKRSVTLVFRNHHPRVPACIGKIIRQTKYEDIRKEDERRRSKEEEKKKKKERMILYAPSIRILYRLDESPA